MIKEKYGIDYKFSDDIKKESIGKTAKCIVCLQDAKIYSGHVLKGDDSVICGWCKNHNNSADIYFMNTLGCHGGWVEAYGLIDDDDDDDDDFILSKGQVLKNL